MVRLRNGVINTFNLKCLIYLGNEVKLMEASATVGPISVAIDASHKSFQMYAGGVYYEPHCSSHTTDHAVSILSVTNV